MLKVGDRVVVKLSSGVFIYRDYYIRGRTGTIISRISDTMFKVKIDSEKVPVLLLINELDKSE